MPMMHVITKGNGHFLTFMGYLPSKDYALKFATASEATQHLNAPENRQLCEGARVEMMDVREDAPPARSGIETDYDPFNVGRDV